MSMARSAVPSVAAAVVIAVTVSLGNWQGRRAEEKLQMQRQDEAAELAAPVSLGPMPASPAQVDTLLARRATVRGRFLPELAVYLDNRTYKGIAGFHVLTPLRIEGDGQGPAAMHVLVLRGWVAGDPRERTAVPLVPTPAEPVEVTGLVERELPQALELQRSGPPGPQQRIWQNVTLAAYRSWSGLLLQPLVLREIGPARGQAGPLDDGLVRDRPRPGLDVGMHRGYEFQWYSLALTTAMLWLWFVVLRPLWVRRTAAHSGK